MEWYSTEALLPSVAARDHSQQLIWHINDAIDKAGGWIDFADFMNLLLYAPRLGYYAAGAVKLGPAGDFTTAPEMTSLFARTLAHPIARTLRELDPQKTTILELGAGTGQLAQDLLKALEQQDSLPKRYAILEVSTDLRERQQENIRQLPPDLQRRVEWLEHWPAELEGVVLANEVLDALPVQRLRWQNGQWHQWGVAVTKEGWHWQTRPLPANSPLLEGMPDMTGYPEPYDTEVGLAAEGLMTLLGQTLKAGQAFFIDYGFPAREFIHPQRSGGTLMCHYRHHAHGDPFLYPGLQDVTAHVDFTRVARAARRAGLQIETWQTQAAWLIEEGILHELEKVHGETSADYRAVSAVQKLLSPAEMGELFKVLVLGQGPENKSALINLGL
ncbi:class I SAM-dependent methyltransferase [Ferrovum myxofaciens]|uniref:class I SAM-dependent methyltransferase n=1 Tax=Ferrovum myxofaciens TaxID=416213 RepID=UPI000AB0A177|nr:SAM-dependent methyltransferase [Ferrovum myxofaciens]